MIQKFCFWVFTWRKWNCCFRQLYAPPSSLLDFPCGSAGKEYARNAGDSVSIPGLGRSPREGKCYPLQYSVLENSRPMQGTWIRFLVWEHSTCCQTARPMLHTYWSLHALGPSSHNCVHSYSSPCAQSLWSATRQATTVRSPCTASREQSPSSATTESPPRAAKTHSQKLNT